MFVVLTSGELPELVLHVVCMTVCMHASSMAPYNRTEKHFRNACNGSYLQTSGVWCRLAEFVSMTVVSVGCCDFGTS